MWLTVLIIISFVNLGLGSESVPAIGKILSGPDMGCFDWANFYPDNGIRLFTNFLKILSG